MIFEKIVTVGKNPEAHRLLRAACKTILVADDPSETSDIIRTSNPDLVIFENTFTPEHIDDFINDSSTYLKDIPVAVMASDVENGHEKECYNRPSIAGYIGHEELNSDLAATLKKIAGKESNVEEDDILDYFLNKIAFEAGIAGKSQAMAHTLKMTEIVAKSNCNPILVVGKTGTGKERIAKMIHDIRHGNQNFIAVNCAALTATLLESELFGHVKGAFTGADKNKIGLLEAAGGGTIFLDEISEMSLELQAKLLRVLQEKTFRKVGDTKDITCTATIIASSNRNLKKEIEKDRFRQDLYYRLNIFPIIIPSLNSPKRKEDIKLLANYFLDTSVICPENAPVTFTKLALDALIDHDWPGNVRELQNTIDRSILIETGDKIGLSSIIFDPDIDDEFDDNCQTPILGKLKDLSIANAEKELIAKVLEQTNWQKTRAAEALGITRATLYSKVKQYDIKQKLSDNPVPAVA